MEAAPYVPENRAATELASDTPESIGAGGGAAQFLHLSDRRLAYRKRLATDRTRDCAGILFLPGFRSDMAGTKATSLDAFCAKRGLSYVRFDYSGHGQSSGRFEDGTIGQWTEDAIAIIDKVGEGSLILVGSSMGGWIMLLAALARPDRVAGLVGVAPAPDFTETLIWDRLTDDERDRLMRAGRLKAPSDYSDEPTTITRTLIEEGRRHLLLSAPIGIHRPVRLLHGTADPDVPYRLSLELAERIASDDVRVTLIKDGDHRLSRAEDLALLGATIEELVR
ncbi:alpha/beta hydrolase [Dongia deserti]|uniref:alpha/beta hydrolase n=1 Tax=Dongia deserti TaxID=2268030 RepID=UPI000E659CA1|nr:alpha/beta hydrolase [Dongia deserti]